MPRFLARLDMYRKVPVDLLEGSRQGSIISWLALLGMATLILFETKSFMTREIVTDLSLDRNNDRQMKVNFNISMMDLGCEFATIDVVSVLGKEQNVTKHVQKWTVDADGIAQRYVHRNMLQHDIVLSDEKITETIEELHEDGEDAVSLDEETLQYALNEHTFVFVDFFASWCSHCRQLAPTWETLAEIMVDAAEHRGRVHEQDYSEQEYDEAVKLHLPVFVGKIDCVVHHQLCVDNEIVAYPTIRLYIDGELYGRGYTGNRNILGFTQYLSMAEESFEKDHEGSVMEAAEEAAARRVQASEEERKWEEGLQRQRHHGTAKWNPEEHPGCQLSGFLMINRAPTHFYIQAQSPHHHMAAHMTNVSHIIHRLSFGDHGLTRAHVNVLPIPGDFEDKMAPMNDNVYITENLHEAFHHYLKLVSTNLYSYQVLQSSQLAKYTTDLVPEAKFVIDLSPIALSYRYQSKRWYDYLTSLMAIIGGTFTVVGMLSSSLNLVSRRVHKRPRPAY